MITRSFRLFLLTGVLILISIPGIAIVEAEEKKGPERWEKNIAEFEQRDLEKPPEPGALLFVGSSSIRMWNLEESWPNRSAINNGFGGSTLADSIHFYSRVIARYAQPEALILYAGDNDIARGLHPRQVSRDFRDLVALFRKGFPETPVVFIAIKPSRKRWELWPKMKESNDLIREQCDASPTLHFADIAAPMLAGAEGPPSAEWFIEDGLHLSEMGYREWTAVVNACLVRARAEN